MDRIGAVTTVLVGCGVPKCCVFFVYLTIVSYFSGPKVIMLTNYEISGVSRTRWGFVGRIDLLLWCCGCSSSL